MVSYEDINVFQIYFLLEKKIKWIWNIIFVEKHKNNTFPYISIDRFLLEKNLDLVIPNNTILPKMLVNLVNLNHHTLLLPIH